MMRLSRFLLLFSIVSLLPACFTKNYSIVVVDKQGQVHTKVLELLSATGIEHDGTLADIVTQTQKHWLRKAGSERWDIEDQIVAGEARARALMSDLGMCAAAAPRYKHYDHMLILGALFDSMQIRMEYAVKLWDAGVRFDSIVLLAGARPAVASQGENEEAFSKLAPTKTVDQTLSTETDMLKFVYEHTAMPEAMRKIPVCIIDVPMLEKADGTLRRPTTLDTIEWWLKTNPVPGTCLAISNQPYVTYQQAVLKTALPRDFTVETVGDACAQEKNIGVLFDTLARILYQEQQFLQKQQAR